jgi:RimJ/RimL family protein N-acetyltransferase
VQRLAGTGVALAFDSLALQRMQASHLPRNPASGRVMQKVGMQREGCIDLPQPIPLAGALGDVGVRELKVTTIYI